MKVELFADVKELKDGDIVAGPSALTNLKLFGELGTPLYEVIKIVDWRFGWFSKHYAKIRRFSDGVIYKINLDPPPFDFTSFSAPIDTRLNWARIEFDPPPDPEGFCLST